MDSGGKPEASLPVPASRIRAVFLVGFMGAGKTSVGTALGRELSWKFEDLDDRIAVREGRTIAQIFRESGEGAFREAEHEALRELIAELGSSGPRVVALGGGAFVQPNNSALLNEPGIATVFLDAPGEELFRRCCAEERERPLCREVEEFLRLYEERRPGYSKAGLLVNTSDKDISSVAAEVASRLGF